MSGLDLLMKSLMRLKKKLFRICADGDGRLRVYCYTVRMFYSVVSSLIHLGQALPEELQPVACVCVCVCVCVCDVYVSVYIPVWRLSLSFNIALSQYI